MSTPPDDLLLLSREDLIARIHALEAAQARRGGFKGTWKAFIADVSVKAMAGANLHKATREGWAAWDRWQTAGRQKAWPKDETREFLAALLSRLTRVRTIYLLVAILPTLFIGVQIWILVNQNSILNRQSALMAFEQTSTLRTKLFRPPLDARGVPIEDFDLAPPDRVARWPAPNTSTILAITQFAQQQDRLGDDDVVRPALRPLLQDNATSVSSGALLVLQQLDRPLDAPGAQLRQAELNGQVLQAANLTRANLQQARLLNTNLTEANLTEANLDDADLTTTNLQQASLQRATLRAATLDGTDVSNANLREANLGFADVSNANFEGADLRGANLNGLRNWRTITSLDGATITDIRNAPNGFKEWALSQGARQ